MNMYLHELKVYRKSTIIWTCSIIALIVLMMSLFTSFSKDAELVQEMMHNFPEAMQKALGLSTLDMTSLLGYYGYLFTFILICGAIQAMNLGVGILSAEVREKTADFLLVKPVTRKKIITSKLLAALTCVVITNVLYLVAVIIRISAFKSYEYSMKLLIMISLSLFFIQLIFFSLGFIISVVVRKIKSVLPVSLGIVFGMYILNALGSAIGDEKIRYISPFRYFDVTYILENEAYEVPFMIISIVFVIIAIVASYILYSKKDINAF